MRDREILLETIDVATAPDEKDVKAVLTVRARYNEGGMSYFTGRTSPRGYVVHMMRETVGENHRGFHIGGNRMVNRAFVLAETKRYNANTLAKLAATAMADPRYDAMKAECLAACVTAVA